jgi:hypothetical protein
VAKIADKNYYSQSDCDPDKSEQAAKDGAMKNWSWYKTN